jgi:hypothetical protein
VISAGKHFRMEGKIGRTPEETMEGGIRLNWEVIFAEARKRRKEWGLTQEHLVAVAKVGRPANEPDFGTTAER